MTPRFSVLLVAVLAVSCAKSATAPTPPVTLTGLTITGNTTFTDFLQASQLGASLSLSNSTTQDQTLASAWTSSNVAVASVTNNGLVTALASGTSEISATYQGQTGRKTVSVTIPCQVNNTANVTLGNRGTVPQIVSWDGISQGTINPGQNTATFATSAGIPHTLQFLVASTRQLACSTATPILVQCDSRIFTCSF